MGKGEPVRLVVTGKKGTIFHCRAARDPKTKKVPKRWEGLVVKFSVSDLVFPSEIDDFEKRKMFPEKGDVVFAAGFEQLDEDSFSAKEVAFREHQVK